MKRLTLTLVQACQPGLKDLFLRDHEVKGLACRVQPSGRKTWVVRYRTRARVQRFMTIGRVSDLTLNDARAKARRIFAAVADGGDPAAEAAAELNAPTVADLAERHIREHAKPFLAPSTARDQEKVWKQHLLPKLGSRRVDGITKADVLAVQAAMAETPARANHAVAILGKAMNLAEDWGWRPQNSNPARRVKKFRLNEREVVLTREQIGELLVTMDTMVAEREMPWSAALWIKLLLLTGCRESEIRTARREWLDLERGLLMLPRTKTGQRRIHLPPTALALILATTGGEWLCPQLDDPASPLKTPRHWWSKLRERLPWLGRVRLHDLRHTVGSLAHRAGLSQREIAAVLGHRQLSTTARYLHGIGGDEARAVALIAEVSGLSAPPALPRPASPGTDE